MAYERYERAVAKFADRHGLTVKQAKALIDLAVTPAEPTENLMIEEVRDRLINQGVEWEKVYKPVQSISKWLEDAYM